NFAPPVVTPDNPETSLLATKYLNQVQDIMQTYCSVVKTTQGLHVALQQLKQVEQEAANDLSMESISFIDLKLSLSTALLIVELSLKVKKNQGVFYNTDLAAEA